MIFFSLFFEFSSLIIVLSSLGMIHTTPVQQERLDGKNKKSNNLTWQGLDLSCVGILREQYFSFGSKMQLVVVPNSL